MKKILAIAVLALGISFAAAAQPKAIGFIFKNTAGNNRLDKYVNSVDEVERITGIDFFPALPDDVERRVEAQCNPELWGLAASGK